MMPDISYDPSQPQSHRVPEEYRQEDVSQRAARTQRRSSTDHDSLSSILKDIRDLARDLEWNPTASDNAQRCERLADRLKRVMYGKG